MKNKNFISAVIASAVLASGTVALAAYTYLKKGKGADDIAEPDEPDEENGEFEEEEPEETEPEDTELEEEALAEEAADEAAGEESLAEPDDLESYMKEHPEEEESLNAVKDSFSADGVVTDISVTGNTMFFDFAMTDVDDDDTKAALKPDLESFLDDQSDSYADVVRTMEDETGLEGIKMIVIFMDAEGNEIVSGHYDRVGRVL